MVLRAGPVALLGDAVHAMTADSGQVLEYPLGTRTSAACTRISAVGTRISAIGRRTCYAIPGIRVAISGTDVAIDCVSR
eukprot:908012-Rhodomonas_salina.2